MANSFPGVMVSINLPNPRSSMSHGLINTESHTPIRHNKLLEVRETNRPESSGAPCPGGGGGRQNHRPLATGSMAPEAQGDTASKTASSEERSLGFAATDPPYESESPGAERTD